VEYLLKANLRVEGGAFSKQLQDAEGITTGRIDSRYRGPDLNRLSEEAEYDPQASAVSGSYATAINDYLRTELKFGKDETYKTPRRRLRRFNFDHRLRTRLLRPPRDYRHSENQNDSDFPAHLGRSIAASLDSANML